MEDSASIPNLPILRGWAPIVFLPTAVVLFTPVEWPRWLFMWLLAIALFAGCKWLTWRRTPVAKASWQRQAGFLLAWPGLDAKAFLQTSFPRVPSPTRREWIAASGKSGIGAVLFFGAARLFPTDRELLMGWVGMVGLVLMLHFGFFHLLSCVWRSVGVDAQPLMKRPLLSKSLSEFWGTRWNTAFRDLTHQFLFRPLALRWGPRWAVMIGFLFSGLIHDLVISLPAEGGYGWPTLYFVIQLVGLLLERSRIGRKVGLGRGWRGRVFTLLVLAGPAYGLFHPPFVRNVVVPFMTAIGGS